MAQNHEDLAAELHATLAPRKASVSLMHKEGAVDLSGAPLGALVSVDKAGFTDSETQGTIDGDEPTDEEVSTLRRVGDAFPKAAYLIAVVELCERFTYYGCQGLFQNYITNSRNGEDGTPGLGLGHAGATGLNTFFQFFAYLTPIPAAIVADQYIGKYKMILYSALIYWVGLIILWTTSLPAATAHGAGIGGYATAVVIIAIGTGGIKSNIAPLIADQYTRRKIAVTTIEKTGERVIIDPAITYQRIYMMFYGCINLGCLSLLATPFMEKYEGFWTAYLMCFYMFCIAVVIVILSRNRYIVRPPQGHVITDSFKAIGMMIANRNMDAAKPSWRAINGKSKPIPWNDHFIDELKRALRACKAAQMELHGMPNDIMQNFDPISILVFIPILDRIVYPALRKAGIELKPIARITIGLCLAGLCLAYAAIVQHLIYIAGPCYGKPGCLLDTNGIKVGNRVHVAVQTPAYVFIGVSEIFISVTGLEYAYTKAPPSMKSFVQSMYLFTNAIGSALNEALVPATGDPAILWMYTGIAVAAFVAAIATHLIFHKYDSEERQMNELNANDSFAGRPGEQKEDYNGT